MAFVSGIAVTIGISLILLVVWLGTQYSYVGPYTPMTGTNNYWIGAWGYVAFLIIILAFISFTISIISGVE